MCVATWKGWLRLPCIRPVLQCSSFEWARLTVYAGVQSVNDWSRAACWRNLTPERSLVPNPSGRIRIPKTGTRFAQIRLWHTQPAAAKMGHKHSLHYRGDRLRGPAPGPCASLFVLPALSLARLHTSPIGPLFCCPTCNVSGASSSCIFVFVCTQTAVFLPFQTRFTLWASALANRTWT